MAPSQPTFDYYAELKVEKTATTLEIAASYRQLARIHHPDKNRDNVEAATAAFKRLGEAYEVLSDSTKRSRYDAALLGTARAQQYYESDEDDTYYGDSDDSDEYDEYDYGDEDDYSYGSFHSHHQPYFSPEGFSVGGIHFSYVPPPSRSYAEMERRFAAMEADERRRDEEKRKINLERYRQKQAKEELRKKAKQDLRNKQEDEKRKAAENAEEEEKRKQEARWKEAGAVLRDEKLASCLHSEFCTKQQQKKKFKCAACNVKRGLTAFECPYCAQFLCQLCVGNFTRKREQADLAPRPKAQPAAAPNANDQEKASPPSESSSNAKSKKAKGSVPKEQAQPAAKKPEAASSEVPKSSTKKEAETPVVDESTHAPTASSPSQKMTEKHATKDEPVAVFDNETASVAAENDEPAADPKVLPPKANPTQNNKANKTASAAAENDEPAADPKVLPPKANPSQNNKANKTASAAAENDEPAADPKVLPPKANPAQDTKANTRAPTPGATCAFIKNAKASYGVTRRTLLQAMDAFGPVASVASVNLHRGIAIVNFKTHDGLCKAMAASPVAVGQANVIIAEGRKCVKCGKPGHLAKQCKLA